MPFYDGAPIWVTKMHSGGRHPAWLRRRLRLPGKRGERPLARIRGNPLVHTSGPEVGRSRPQTRESTLPSRGCLEAPCFKSMLKNADWVEEKLPGFQMVAPGAGRLRRDSSLTRP